MTAYPLHNEFALPPAKSAGRLARSHALHEAERIDQQMALAAFNFLALALSVTIRLANGIIRRGHIEGGG